MGSRAMELVWASRGGPVKSLGIASRLTVAQSSSCVARIDRGGDLAMGFNEVRG
jgi:hypothetical protein